MVTHATKASIFGKRSLKGGKELIIKDGSLEIRLSDHKSSSEEYNSQGDVPLFKDSSCILQEYSFIFLFSSSFSPHVKSI